MKNLVVHGYAVGDDGVKATDNPEEWIERKTYEGAEDLAWRLNVAQDRLWAERDRGLHQYARPRYHAVVS